ncbi:hypothetical protein M758_6G071200 [Ceratodon purpureus]|nr:hypothetical protein M758_6G071200 [Ceratodon purpureus]
MVSGMDSDLDKLRINATSLGQYLPSIRQKECIQVQYSSSHKYSTHKCLGVLFSQIRLRKPCSTCKSIEL